MKPLRAQLAAVAVGALAFQLLLAWLPPAVGRALADTLIALTVGTATVVYVRRLRSESGRHRRSVLLGVVAGGLWTIANIGYLVNELAGSPIAFAIGMGGSIGAAMVLPVGLHLSAPAVRGHQRYRALIDIATVAGAVFALSWVYVLEPARAAGASGAAFTFTTVLTALEVLAAAVALVTMSRNFPGRTGLSPRILGAASVVLAATAMLAIHDGTDGQAWYSGVGAGYLLAAGLILVASRVVLPRDEQTGAATHFVGRWATLPYVPIALAVAAVAVEQLRHDVLGPVLVWTLLTTFSLVLIRQFLTVAIVGRLAVTLERQGAELAHQAHHDALTGLHNRAAFHALGDDLLTGEATVLLIDLDGFKPINDWLGHAAGDEVLVTVAHRIRDAVRPDDLVSRLGGDEFALILTGPDTTGPDPMGMVDRIHDSLTDPIEVRGETVTVGASIGAAPADGRSLDALLQQADSAMYAAKAAGRRTAPV